MTQPPRLRHVPTRKLKFLGVLANGATPASGDPNNWDGEIVWVTPDDLGQLGGRYISDSRRKITQDGYTSCGTKLVPGGSLILSTRAPIGHLAISTVEACFNQGCKGFSPNDQAMPEYVYYWLKAHKNDLQNLGQGTTFVELSRHALANFKVGAPPLERQREIVAYLDLRCGEIDDLIAKKRGLLGLLAEKRSALITRAVTKGLDPTAPMKPSGIDWLGDIPAHWEARRFYQTFRMKSGAGITALEMNPEGEYPVYGGNGIRGAADSYTHDGEYVLVGRQGALCGNVHVASGQFWASEHALVVYPTIQLDIGWLRAVLEAMNLRQYSVATAQPGLSVDNLSLLKLPVPPHEEQEAISALINKESTEIRKSEALIQHAIDQLTEYRAAIITKAVTGELEVT